VACRGEQNFWCGTKMSTKVNSAVDDTLGLMVVSCICTGFAWLFMTMISQGNVATQRKYFYEATCGLMVASAFFTMCAASVMDGSQLKNIFCGVFDPDANIGVYCGYGDGFYAVRALSLPIALFSRSVFSSSNVHLITPPLPFIFSGHCWPVFFRPHCRAVLVLDAPRRGGWCQLFLQEQCL